MTEHEILTVRILFSPKGVSPKVCGVRGVDIVSGVEVEGHQDASVARFAMQCHDGEESQGRVGLGGGRSKEEVILVLMCNFGVFIMIIGSHCKKMTTSWRNEQLHHKIPNTPSYVICSSATTCTSMQNRLNSYQRTRRT